MGRPFLFKCPTKGLTVQGFIDDDDEPAAEREGRRVAVKCLACGQIHVVSPSSSKPASDDD